MEFLFILSFFPLFCVSMAASCTSTRTPGGTEYVLDASCPPHCDHSWSNSTGHVIANAKDEAEQVLDQNSSRLHIRDCDDVTLSCHCFPDGELYNATCDGNCTKAAGLKQEALVEVFSSPHGTGGRFKLCTCAVLKKGLLLITGSFPSLSSAYSSSLSSSSSLTG
ncbi:uncharacterized protein ACNS7B_017320 isoform 1-T1 [Menidia menidia]